jgi:hypothetical protein
MSKEHSASIFIGTYVETSSLAYKLIIFACPQPFTSQTAQALIFIHSYASLYIKSLSCSDPQRSNHLAVPDTNVRCQSIPNCRPECYGNDHQAAVIAEKISVVANVRSQRNQHLIFSNVQMQTLSLQL